MANDNQVILVGNLTDDPELRYTPSGTAVASFTVAINRRVRDQATGEWRDGDTSFFKCNVWRQQAEHVAESLHKGTRAIVIGQLRTRSWETPEGQKRSVTEVEVDHVGPSLQWATTEVRKTPRGEGVPAFAGASVSNGSSDGTPLPDEEPPF
ncbi:MAG TPA: single-stranded DNA-binding protein [Actinomycetota bacterium]|nr:single-stranded DNA-binding protein [Actinomycetota bacterium]